MPTLTPATTIRWINRLAEIEAHCVSIIDKRDPGVPLDVWKRALDAKIAATMMREDLMVLAVAPIELETV